MKIPVKYVGFDGDIHALAFRESIGDKMTFCGISLYDVRILEYKGTAITCRYCIMEVRHAKRVVIGT